MSALLRAELLKLRSTRLPLGLFLGTLAMVAVTVKNLDTVPPTAPR